MGWTYIKINYICDSKAGGKQLIISVYLQSPERKYNTLRNPQGQA